MIDLALWPAAALLLITTIVLMVVGRMATPNPEQLADLFRARPDGWPKGVQEEDPDPWRFDRLDRMRPDRLSHPTGRNPRDRAPSPAGREAVRPRRVRDAVGCGTELDGIEAA
jgi:hypothetical protein